MISQSGVGGGRRLYNEMPHRKVLYFKNQGGCHTLAISDEVSVVAFPQCPKAWASSYGFLDPHVSLGPSLVSAPSQCHVFHVLVGKKSPCRGAALQQYDASLVRFDVLA